MVQLSWKFWKQLYDLLEVAMKKPLRILTLSLLTFLILGIGALPAYAANVLALPISLENIEAEAFEGATSLGDVYLSENVLSIGSRAFADSSLTYIWLPASLQYIAPDAFEGASPIFEFASGSYAEQWYQENYGPATEDHFSCVENRDGTVTLTGYTGQNTYLELPAAVNGMPVSALGDGFLQDSSVESLHVPGTVRSIGSNAFSGCTKLSYIYLSEGVESLGSRAFFGCTKLTRLVLPDSLCSIGAEAFRESAIQTINIPMNVAALPEGAFFHCTALSSVRLPETMTAIGDSCFEGCTALTRIPLHENLLTIGSRAFADSGLTLVQLPYSLTYIADDAFEGTDCTIQYISGSYAEQWYQQLLFSYEEVSPKDLTYAINDDGTVTITGYTGSAWGLILPAELDGRKVTAIGERSFFMSEIIGIQLPETITKIGNSAFQSCDNLKEIMLPEGLTEIEGLAFNGCQSLKSVHLPDSLTKLGTDVFFSCTALSEVNYPKNLAEGGSYLFSQTAIEELVIPDGVTWLPDGLFSQCSKLTSVLIPDSVIQIGYNCFSHCTALETIDLPDGLTYIDGNLFAFCSALKSIVIPEKVTAIYYDAFQDCTSLTSVVLPEGLLQIGTDFYNDDGVFRGCTSLKSINLPQSLNFIAPKTFRNCDALETVILPESVRSIYIGTFSDCDNLKKVYVPKNTKCEYFYGAGSGSGYFDNSPKLEIHTEYGAYVLEHAIANSIPYFYLSLTDRGLDWESYYEGDPSSYLGRVRSSDPLIKVETQVYDSSGKQVFNVLTRENNTSALISVNISHLVLGNYRYQVHAWADNGGSEEYRLLLDSEFTVVSPPLRMQLTDDFKPPEVVHRLESPYSPNGSLVSNNYIVQIQASMTNTETGEVHYSPLYTPNTKSFSMADLHADFNFSDLPGGEYVYRIMARFPETSRLVYTQNILIANFDGIMDASLAKKIIQFCDPENNPLSVFTPFDDYQTVLNSISDLDGCLMAMPAGNDWLVSNIVGAFTGVEGDAFIVNLYKKEILNMLQSMGEGPELISADSDISIAKNFVKAFELSGDYSISAMKENFRYTKQLYKYAILDNYKSILEGATDAEINELVECDMMHMSKYLEELEDDLSTLSKIAEGSELTLDALKIFAMAMNDYQNMLALLDSLEKSYVGKLPTEYRSALDIVKAEYQSSISIIITETFSKIGEEVVKEGISLASKTFVNLLSGFSSSGGFTLSCGKFAMQLAFQLSGLDDFSDNYLAFLTQTNLVYANKQSYILAVSKVLEGDQSSQALQNVYSTFMATRTCLISVYRNMRDNELHDNPNYISSQWSKIENLSIV